MSQAAGTRTGGGLSVTAHGEMAAPVPCHPTPWGARLGTCSAALGVGGAEDAAPQEAPERTGPPCGCSLAESQPLPGPFLSCVFFPQTSRSKCQFLLKEFSERASVRLECFI